MSGDRPPDTPRLTPEQARAAELFRKLFRPLPPDPEAEEGDDPNYDLTGGAVCQ